MSTPSNTSHKVFLLRGSGREDFGPVNLNRVAWNRFDWKQWSPEATTPPPPPSLAPRPEHPDVILRPARPDVTPNRFIPGHLGHSTEARDKAAPRQQDVEGVRARYYGDETPTKKRYSDSRRVEEDSALLRAVKPHNFNSEELPRPEFVSITDQHQPNFKKSNYARVVSPTAIPATRAPISSSTPIPSLFVSTTPSPPPHIAHPPNSAPRPSGPSTAERNQQSATPTATPISAPPRFSSQRGSKTDVNGKASQRIIKALEALGTQRGDEEINWKSITGTLYLMASSNQDNHDAFKAQALAFLELFFTFSSIDAVLEGIAGILDEEGLLPQNQSPTLESPPNSIPSSTTSGLKISTTSNQQNDVPQTPVRSAARTTLGKGKSPRALSIASIQNSHDDDAEFELKVDPAYKYNKKSFIGFKQYPNYTNHWYESSAPYSIAAPPQSLSPLPEENYMYIHRDTTFDQKDPKGRKYWVYIATELSRGAGTSRQRYGFSWKPVSPPDVETIHSEFKNRYMNAGSGAGTPSWVKFPDSKEQ